MKFLGIPYKEKRPGDIKERVAIRAALQTTSATALGCDSLILGLGIKELDIVKSYVAFTKVKRKDPKKSLEFKRAKHLLRKYGHYIDVATEAYTLGLDVIGIGRSKPSEAASFGEAATKNKLEIVQLFSLYLRKGNVLKDLSLLQEFQTLAPSIYYAVISESALYAFYRLHEHIYNIPSNPLYKKRNIKILVAVDEWILQELLILVNTKLTVMIVNKSPPMTEAIRSIDNCSRSCWSRFLLQFIMAPMLFTCWAIAYKLYSIPRQIQHIDPEHRNPPTVDGRGQQQLETPFRVAQKYGTRD